jgi:hypothetical protein
VIAGLIEQLGGTVIPADTLRFDLPLSEVRTAIPRLTELGIGCRRLGERTEAGPAGPHSVTTIECFPANQGRSTGLDFAHFTDLDE